MSLTHLAAALLMVTIWGFNFIVIRWGLNDVPPLTLTLLRFALAAFPAVLVCTPAAAIMAPGDRLRVVRVHRPVWTAIRGHARWNADRARLVGDSGSGVLHHRARCSADAGTHKAGPVDGCDDRRCRTRAGCVSFAAVYAHRILPRRGSRGIVGDCKCDRQAHSQRTAARGGRMGKCCRIDHDVAGRTRA